MTEYVEHTFVPIYDDRTRVLLLGTMPSPRSRKNGFYYGHPQNRFWRVLGALWNEPVPASIEEKKAFLYAHHLGLWDVLRACDIDGASDASIRNAQPNNLAPVLAAAPITAIATTGTKAAHYYEKFDAPLYPELAVINLPSPSAANARMHLDDLIAAYKPLVELAD